MPGSYSVDLGSALRTLRIVNRGVLGDWETRAEIARGNGHAGDLLTLARDAPTRVQRESLVLQAALTLTDQRRYATAESILVELLASNPDNVDAARALERARDGLDRPAEGRPPPRFDNVVVCSGHMVDEPNRPEPRFPQELEPAVRQRIDDELEIVGAGPGTLAICGGARGADIIFGELAHERGAELRVLLALPEAEMLERSVGLPGDVGRWAERFHRLVEHADVAIQPERLGEPPPGVDPFSRTNRWILDTARVEAPSRGFSTILVWDERPNGDGPGGTSDFADEAARMSARFAIVNPTRLEGDR